MCSRQPELQELELVIPCSKIDFHLLAKQRNGLDRIRSRITSSRQKDFETLSGVLHLFDYLIDTYLDAIGNLVLIQDYTGRQQYFITNPMHCRNQPDLEAYEQAVWTRKIASANAVIGCPSKCFSPHDWASFRNHGLNHPFELL